MAGPKSLSELRMDLASRRSHLETLLASNQTKTDQLTGLTAAAERNQALLNSKMNSLVAKDRLVRDGGVVSDKMANDVRSKNKQLQRLTNAETSRLRMVNNTFDAQLSELLGVADHLKVAAEFLTQGAAGDSKGSGLDEAIEDLKAKVKELEMAIDMQAKDMEEERMLEEQVQKNTTELAQVEDELRSIEEELEELAAESQEPAEDQEDINAQDEEEEANADGGKVGESSHHDSGYDMSLQSNDDD